MIHLPTEIILDRLKKYLDDCDGDELARLTGEMFGGECFQNKNNPDIYDFKPNENYTGEFNDLPKK